MAEQEPMSSTSKQNMREEFKCHILISKLIEEVKIRPCLWDRSVPKSRYKQNKEWAALSARFRIRPALLKAKWRNIKDTFHREAKRVLLTTDVMDKSIMHYYNGVWQHFESLLFLWDFKRHLKKDITDDMDAECDNPEEYLDNIKVEKDASDLSNEDLNYSSKQNYDFVITETISVKEEPKIFHPIAVEKSDVTFAPQTKIMYDATKVENKDMCGEFITQNTNVNDTNQTKVMYDVIIEENTNVHETDKKQQQSANECNLDQQHVEKKKRCEQNCGVIENCELDEDLHFAKSLVPFMRKLNPIRKLIVRNEMHSLLLKELLCNKCKVLGPQPNCSCNY